MTLNALLVALGVVVLKECKIAIERSESTRTIKPGFYAGDAPIQGRL